MGGAPEMQSHAATRPWDGGRREGPVGAVVPDRGSPGIFRRVHGVSRDGGVGTSPASPRREEESRLGEADDVAALRGESDAPRRRRAGGGKCRFRGAGTLGLLAARSGARPARANSPGARRDDRRAPGRVSEESPTAYLSLSFFFLPPKAP